MRLESRPSRGLLQLLEAVDEAERLRVEERELLLDGDREIGHRVERLARVREHLLVAELLLLAHAKSLLTLLKRAERAGTPRSSARTCGAASAGRARPATTG